MEPSNEGVCIEGMKENPQVETKSSRGQSRQSWEQKPGQRDCRKNAAMEARRKMEFSHWVVEYSLQNYS